MHLELSGAGAASHAQVLDGPPETEEDVALEVRDDDEGPGLGDVAGDPDFREDLPGNGDLRFLFAPLAVCNDDGDPQGAKAVLPGDFQVVRRVVAQAPVEGIGIGEEVIGIVPGKRCRGWA